MGKFYESIFGIDPSAALGAASNLQNTGSTLFNNAYSAADGSLAGTAAAGAGIVAALPPGSFKTAVSSATGIASSAMAGMSVGSVIPGYGTAIGAVVGAVIGIISSIGSSTPPQPEGEFRVKCEQFCVPALPLTPQAGQSASSIAQTLIQPVCWPDIRCHTVGFQTLTDPPDGGSPSPTQDRAVGCSFGVGWVSPPQSTANSTNQAWYLAQAFIGQGGISQNVVNQTAEQKAYVTQMMNQAVTMLGSQQAYNTAMALLKEMYGARFSANYNASQMLGSLDIGRFFKGTPGTILAWLKTQIAALNVQPTDYTYYCGDYLLIQDGNSNWSAASIYGYSVSVGLGGDMATRLAAMPDTIVIGLAEICCLVATGVIPQHGAFLVAFHYVMGHAWLWRRAQITDVHPIANHPNYSRIIGILSQKLHSNNPATAGKPLSTSPNTSRTAGTSGRVGQSLNNSAKLTNASQSSSMNKSAKVWPWVVGVLAAVGIYVATKDKKS